MADYVKSKCAEAGPNAVGGLLSDLKMISAYNSAANWDVSFSEVFAGRVCLRNPCFLIDAPDNSSIDYSPA